MSNFFDYFQIAALVLYLLLFSGKSFYIHFSKNINPVTIVVGKKGKQRILEIIFIIGLLIWIIEVLLYSLHLKFRLFPSILDMQLIDSILARFVGTLMIAIGFVIYAMALIALGASWRMGIDYEAPGELVTTEIYAVSRNPIFVFLGLYFFGSFLINGTLIFLVFAVAAVIALHYQILQEEEFLAKAHGKAYRDYCARTGRYFTWKYIYRI